MTSALRRLALASAAAPVAVAGLVAGRRLRARRQSAAGDAGLAIREKIRVPINGVEQGIFLRGRNAANPVLLFLHGGPGMPEFWLTRRYPTRLEDAFTVAWWEQRGAGLSFHSGIAPETMTIEQFVDDTLAVADYLRARFGTDRVYLMAHSWGSYVGIQAAARSPERFAAYVGVAQITHQVRSEELSYAYMVERFRALGDERMAPALEAAPPPFSVPLPASYDRLRDKTMHMLGVGTTHDMRSVVRDIFLPSWRSPDYTIGEKVGLWRGKLASRRAGLWDRMQATDVAELVPELAIPAYFLHGVHDYTVSYPMAKAYAARLRAPLAAFYTFEHSAHSPMFEEPDRTLRILTEDVLARRTTLADRDGASPPSWPAG